jgi:hypothetical protein
MRALVLGCPGVFRVAEVPVPAPCPAPWPEPWPAPWPAEIVKARAVTGPGRG